MHYQRGIQNNLFIIYFKVINSRSLFDSFKIYLKKKKVIAWDRVYPERLEANLLWDKLCLTRNVSIKIYGLT